MLTIPKAKEWIDAEIVYFLECLSKVLTLADLGPSAKQADVTKVRGLIAKRIEKFKS